MKTHLHHHVEVWERSRGENFGPWHLWHLLGFPLWDGCCELSSSTMAGEKRWGHPLTAVSGPAAPERAQALAGGHLLVIRGTSG